MFCHSKEFFFINFMKDCFSVVLIFMMIFSFSLPVIKTSSVLAFLLAVCWCLYVGKIKHFFSFLASHLFLKYVMASLGLCFFSVIIAYAHSSFDYTIPKLLFTQIIYMVFSVFVASAVISLSNDNNKIEHYVRLIALAFVFQTIIMTIAAFEPSIRNFVQMFQPAGVADASERYNGYRGIALASGQFFSLSVAYGLAIIYFALTVLNKKINFSNTLIFLLICIGILYAGRTAFVALGLVFIVYLFEYKRKFFVLLFKVFVWVFLIYIVLNILSLKTLDAIVNNVFSYAFEFIYNYLEYGELATSSTDKLDTMYFELPYRTLLFGDGRLFDSNGSYYMNTDAGYMRYTLFGGVGFTVLLILNQLTVFYKYDKVFIVVFAYLLITNYKGMSISLLLIVQSMMMMFAIYTRHIEETRRK